MAGRPHRDPDEEKQRKQHDVAPPLRTYYRTSIVPIPLSRRAKKRCECCEESMNTPAARGAGNHGRRRHVLRVVDAPMGIRCRGSVSYPNVAPRLRRGSARAGGGAGVTVPPGRSATACGSCYLAASASRKT